MDELIDLVVQKTGISAENARSAVDTVLSFVKGKLPSMVGDQIDQAISGGGAGKLGDIVKGLGGMFGNK